VSGELLHLRVAVADAGRIYPPEGYSWWWWLVVAGCLLGVAAVGIWASLTLRALRDSGADDDPLAGLRVATLDRIAEWERAAEAGRMSVAEAHQRLGAEVRRFAGIATGGDADYLVLPELRRAAERDLRLVPVVELVASLQEVAFAAPAAVALDGGEAGEGTAFARARSVVLTWT